MTKKIWQSARSMGRAALDVGLSKSAWRDAFTFAKGLDLGEELANGVWLEEEAEPLNGWPAALDPLAIILGLVLSVPKSIQQKDAELSEGDAFVVIDHQEAKAISVLDARTYPRQARQMWMGLER